MGTVYYTFSDPLKRTDPPAPDVDFWAGVRLASAGGTLVWISALRWWGFLP